MAAIDIGAAATDRGTTIVNNYTVIGKENPANDTGAITSVEIWAETSYTACEVATFDEVSASHFTTRDTETIGAVTSGSKQTFSGLDMDVATGDYLGIYGPDGKVERDTSGDGWWYISGDSIPCTNTEFTGGVNETISLYGIGATVGVTHELAGVIAGVASVSGSVLNQKWLAGVIAGVASTSGAASILFVLAGTSGGVATITGSASILKKIAGTITGLASVTGNIIGTWLLRGTVAGIATVAGATSVLKKLAGIVAGIATTTGAVSVLKRLAGVITGICSTAGSLLNPKSLAGVVTGVCSIIGTLAFHLRRRHILAFTNLRSIVAVTKRTIVAASKRNIVSATKRNIVSSGDLREIK